jgi:1-acyl-sn-glycerol-3-phosphate acyltransferase
MAVIEEIVKINYPENIKRQIFVKKKPKRQSLIVPPIVFLLVPILLAGRKVKIQRVNMEKLNKRRPFLLLCTHSSFNDFPIMLKSIWPHRIVNVSAIDGFRGMYGFLHKMGRTIPKRKFVNDLTLVKNMIYVLKEAKSIFGLYPEAQYAMNGSLNIIPKSVAKIIKLLGEPVVTLTMHGNSANSPVWGDKKPRNAIPLRPVQTYAFTPEECESMSVDEIHERLVKLMQYDDWKYWQESGAKVLYKNRAVGLNKILYKCPQCGTEFAMMTVFGSHIKCCECGAEWKLTETGFLEGVGHKTKFASVTDWIAYQRKGVRAEIENGTYGYKEICRAWSIPNKKTKVDLGWAHFSHDKNGFVISGNYNDQNFNFTFPPNHSHTIQTELNCPNFDRKDVIALSVIDDSIFLEPTKVGAAYKLNLASEELYKISQGEK